MTSFGFIDNTLWYNFPPKNIATLWLNSEVQRTGNIYRIIPGGVFKGAAHRNI
ncbi:MAG: hypothetical protein KG029_00620 [Bacteroidetes bacterium]|nr:hypothetical protein [Bacteroidota bacterium]